MNSCIITFCNKSHLQKAFGTINQLRISGKYTGDIVLLVGDDLKDLELDPAYNIIVKYFPTIDRTEVLKKLNGISTSDGRDFNKSFQWHKVYAFDKYFKKWDKCLLIDAGMHTFNPIDKILDLDCSNKIFAHSDAYPYAHYRASVEDRIQKRNLGHQFENSERFRNLYDELNTKYNLYVDYFQTGLCLYDTSIIKDGLMEKIFNYADRYINTCTNEQAVLNLIFNCEQNIWVPMPIKDEEIYYYDYFERENLTYDKYIMLKYPQTVPYQQRLY